MAEQALHGIRVLDLSESVSGPYCAKLFGAFGAEVIKAERPGTGDRARLEGPFLDDRSHPETSALFLYLNTNKRGITLNMEADEGKVILRDLVRQSDVLVENFSPGVMEDLRLGYESLEKINPRLVMVSITPFGQSGPYKGYQDGSMVVDALSGYMHLNGDPDREPLSGGGEQPEYQGGLHAFSGAMAALFARENTGEGQHIHVSLLECMASIHQFTINRFVYSGKVQERGNRSPFTHPSGIYPCKDGHVHFTADTDDKVELALTMMGLPEVWLDARFRTNLDRVEHADAFDEAIRPWFRERTRTEIVRICQEWRIPATPFNDVEDLLEDPQYAERGFWTRLSHPDAGTLPYPAAPFRMSETPAPLERAPLLGEHNDEVYCGLLGIARAELTRLEKDGII